MTELTAEPTVEPTPKPPTATPEPTRTPEPTAEPPTPEPTVDPYYETVSGHVADMADALSEISSATINAGETPRLMFDTDWKMGLVVNIATMQFASDSIRGMQPPAAAAAFHAKLADTTHRCDAATNHLARGIDLINTLDAENAMTEFTAATAHMEACNAGMNEAAKLIPSPHQP